MPDLVQMPLAVHNLHGGAEKNKDRRERIIDRFLNASHQGIGGCNELNRHDRKYFKSKAGKLGLRYKIQDNNAAVWDSKLIKVNKTRVRKIMSGGYVGADGVATARVGDDDRRVGPNRYALYLTCTVRANNLDFELVITHLMAKSFTQHRWRIPLLRKSVKKLSAGIKSKNGLLVGDMNSKEYIDLPDVLDVAEKTPPTHGNRRYDQIIRWGPQIDVVKVHDTSTASDHDMLLGIVKFYKGIRR